MQQDQCPNRRLNHNLSGSGRHPCRQAFWSNSLQAFRLRICLLNPCLICREADLRLQSVAEIPFPLSVPSVANSVCDGKSNFDSVKSVQSVAKFPFHICGQALWLQSAIRIPQSEIEDSVFHPWLSSLSPPVAIPSAFSVFHPLSRFDVARLKSRRPHQERCQVKRQQNAKGFRHPFPRYRLGIDKMPGAKMIR